MTLGTLSGDVAEIVLTECEEAPVATTTITPGQSASAAPDASVSAR